LQQKKADGGTAPAAILLFLGALVSFIFLDTTAKYLGRQGLHPQFIAWMRFAVHLVLVSIIFRIWSNPLPLRTGNLPMQVLRGLFLFGSTIFNFFALRTLQLTESTAIYFLSPMVVTALAGPVLGEWAGWRRWAAIGVGFAGMLVVTRPGLAAFNIGYVFSILSMLSYSAYLLMTRKMGATESAASLIFYSALAPVVLMSPLVPIYGSVPPDRFLWLVLVLLGVYGTLGHWLLIKAYKLATTTQLAPFPYLQIVGVTISGYLVFGDIPDKWTVVGSAIIVASGLYIVQRERRLRLSNSAAPNLDDEEIAKKL